MSVTRTKFENRPGGVNIGDTIHDCYDLEWVPASRSPLGTAKDGTALADDTAVVIQFADDPGTGGKVWVFYGYASDAGNVVEVEVGLGAQAFFPDQSGACSVVPVDPSRELRVSLREVTRIV